MLWARIMGVTLVNFLLSQMFGFYCQTEVIGKTGAWGGMDVPQAGRP